MSRYAIGGDAGNESGRAILVDVADGRQLATAVYASARDAITNGGPRATAKGTGR